MFDHSLNCGRKHFCRYCLHAFTTEESLKLHIKNCFKTNGEQMIIVSKKVNMLSLTFLKKIRFMI